MSTGEAEDQDGGDEKDDNHRPGDKRALFADADQLARLEDVGDAGKARDQCGEQCCSGIDEDGDDGQ